MCLSFVNIALMAFAVFMIRELVIPLILVGYLAMKQMDEAEQG